MDDLRSRRTARSRATTDEAKKRAAAVRAARRGGDGYNTGPFDGPEDLTLYVRCITRGLPGSMMPAIYGNSYDITQGPGLRRDPLRDGARDARDSARRPAALPAAIQSYMGDARGHWEGDTLVVETTNLLEKSAYGGASEHLKTTERFRRRRTSTIEWSITFDDPTTWVRPWTFGMRLTKDESPAVRIRLPRGQRGTARHPQRGARRRARNRQQQVA